MIKRKRCVNCGQLTERWHRINGSPYHCYDGCFGTTGFDCRAEDGFPMWVVKFCTRTVRQNKTIKANGHVFAVSAEPGTRTRFGLDYTNFKAYERSE